MPLAKTGIHDVPEHLSGLLGVEDRSIPSRKQLCEKAGLFLYCVGAISAARLCRLGAASHSTMMPHGSRSPKTSLH